jgi:putative membrane protein
VGILIRAVVTFVAVFVASFLLPASLFHIDTLQGAAIFALVLAVVNALVKPIVTLLTCPIQLMTMGLSILVINALLFWLTSAVAGGVQVGGFLGAFVASLVVSVVSWVISIVVRT